MIIEFPKMSTCIICGAKSRIWNLKDTIVTHQVNINKIYCGVRLPLCKHVIAIGYLDVINTAKDSKDTKLKFEITTFTDEINKLQSEYELTNNINIYKKLRELNRDKEEAIMLLNK